MAVVAIAIAVAASSCRRDASSLQRRRLLRPADDARARSADVDDGPCTEPHDGRGLLRRRLHARPRCATRSTSTFQDFDSSTAACPPSRPTRASTSTRDTTLRHRRRSRPTAEGWGSGDHEGHLLRDPDRRRDDDDSRSRRPSRGRLAPAASVAGLADERHAVAGERLDAHPQHGRLRARRPRARSRPPRRASSARPRIAALGRPTESHARW